MRVNNMMELKFNYLDRKESIGLEKYCILCDDLIEFYDENDKVQHYNLHIILTDYFNTSRFMNSLRQNNNYQLLRYS